MSLSNLPLDTYRADLERAMGAEKDLKWRIARVISSAYTEGWIIGASGDPPDIEAIARRAKDDAAGILEDVRASARASAP